MAASVGTMRSMRTHATRWLTTLTLVLVFPLPSLAQFLANPDFEQADDQGKPEGWTVLTGLDDAGYNPPDYVFSFDDVKPIVTASGRRDRGHALAFPPAGTWRCEVTHHDKGRLDGEIGDVSGSRRGKAAVFQSVAVPPGRYRFSAYLRTADGDPWSGAFSLGVALNGTALYAHDDATGIRWTSHDLAMRGNPNDGHRAWGEWQQCRTTPFEVVGDNPITVWIRFNYINRHQTDVKWEVDDAAIEPVRPFPMQIEDPRQDTDNFELNVTISPKPRWQRAKIRFRETVDGDDGYVLSIHHDGQVRLRSLADGLLEALRTSTLNDEFAVGVLARGQYLRVDLPGDTGFETRIIGPTTGRFSVDVEPSVSATTRSRLVAAPPVMPEFPAPVEGDLLKAYDPSPAPDEPWYINDHGVIRDDENLWHMLGITHAEPFSPADEDFLAHATSKRLMSTDWQRQPHVCHVNETAGETHVWAPHIVRKDDVYYMFYCGGGADGDAYQINLRTSTDLKTWRWHEGNPLFTDIGNARDPMVLERPDGEYLMYYTRPDNLEDQHSSVAVRTSDDLIHWSEPQLALVTHRKERFGRLTESPFVFRVEDETGPAWYLSATGIGGYRSTLVWRSVNPLRFNPDHVVARIDAHAPEWICTHVDQPPSHVTHAGWRQGGFHIAPVRWDRQAWTPFGLLVVEDPAVTAERPTRLTIHRRPGDRDPYRVFDISDAVFAYPLPPGRYRISARRGDRDPVRSLPIEIAADERTRIELP